MFWRRNRDLRRKGSSGLAFVPIAVVLLSAPLLVPHGTEPTDLPLPHLSSTALEAAEAADTLLAREELPDVTRALGSEIRELFAAEGRDAGSEVIAEAQRNLRIAKESANAVGKEKSLVALRAVELELFLAEVRTFEVTGVVSDEMIQLSGNFVASMRLLGWIRGSHVDIDRYALRVAYKVMWNRAVAVDGLPAFEIPLEEMRALYAFLLTHTSVADDTRIAGLRASAETAEQCEHVVREERTALAARRLQRVKNLIELDPEYPKGYALGIAYYRVGRFPQAAQSFREWIAQHPQGEYAARARNYLRASMLRESGT